MTTIKDIASSANVSSSIVRRILNHDPNIQVSQETEMRIFKFAEEMNYASKNPRSNKIRHKLTIGIIENFSKYHLMDDPYYLYLINTAERYCLAQDINTVKFMMTGNSYKSTSDLKIDGLIAFGKFTKQDAQALRKITENIVFIDSSPDDSQFNSVMANIYQGTYRAMEYLYSLGHRRIAFVGDGYSSSNNRIDDLDVRQEAYQVFMKRNNLYDKDLIYSGERFSYSEGRRITQKMLNRTSLFPSAIFIANDSMAIALQSTLISNGIRIPEDISLIGCNDLPATKYLVPSLTTIHIPLHAMIECALDMISKNTSPPTKYIQKIYVSTSLVERKSCCPVAMKETTDL